MTPQNNLDIERTLCLIKPDAVSSGKIGEILTILENNNFNILKMKMLQMNRNIAQRFYYIHKNKHFYDELIEFMTSGPIITMVLEREDAINRLRRLAGDTDSKIADKGTIRNRYGTDIQRNAIHASDSIESAVYEIDVIFRHKKKGEV
ncbi:MAG: nucleoside-diphosphate kinase [Candidatus Cloacimonadota bacterium]|nr:nucleoside-diphosphate kinase [Candidatus Cloacimonadota bacterium]